MENKSQKQNNISDGMKLITILGPTASGKTKLAVKLAQKFNGEIVSADSRQVYKGMDIGTGKDLKEYIIEAKDRKSKIKIPYHLIDIVSPKEKFSLAKYQKLAFKAIDDIIKRGKLPILVGGSGLYLWSVIYNYNIPKLKPDFKFRKSLEEKSPVLLISIIKKLNPSFEKKISESDKKNKRRLVRYYEVLKKDSRFKPQVSEKKYNVLILGISKPKEELQKRIYNRLIERFEKEDMIGEVKRLRKSGLSWKRLEDFGLEYKFISFYLQNKIDYKEMVEKLFIAIKQFSKKQLTWFRRDKNIKWISCFSEAQKEITRFIQDLK